MAHRVSKETSKKGQNVSGKSGKVYFELKERVGPSFQAKRLKILILHHFEGRTWAMSSGITACLAYGHLEKDLAPYSLPKVRTLPHI
jgi:hypothetical protein